MVLAAGSVHLQECFFFSAEVRAGASSLERRHVDEAQKGGGMQVVESRVHHFEPKKR